MFFKSLAAPGKCTGLFSQYSPRPQTVLIAGGVCPRQGSGTPQGLGTQRRSLGSVLLTGRRPRDQTQGPWPDLWPLQGLSSPVFRKARKGRSGCRRGGGIKEQGERGPRHAVGPGRQPEQLCPLPVGTAVVPGRRACSHAAGRSRGRGGTLPPTAQDHSYCPLLHPLLAQ